MAFIFSTCDDGDEIVRDFPLLKTYEVEDGTMLRAEIIQSGKQKIIEYGFLWDESPVPSIHSSEKWTETGSPNSAQFEYRLTSPLKANTLYYIQSFIKTEEYLVYGSRTSFLNQ